MRKKHENYTVYGLLALTIFLLVFSVYGFSKTTDTTDETSSITDKTESKSGINAENEKNSDHENVFEPVETGSTGSGDVSVELTPSEITDNILKIKVSINTHSVDLSPFDLKQITTLEYDGKEIKPISAPMLRGHHSRGEMVFEVEKKLRFFTVKIKGIPRVNERIFSWGNNNL